MLRSLTSRLLRHAAGAVDRVATVAVQVGTKLPVHEDPLPDRLEERLHFLRSVAERYAALSQDSLFPLPELPEPASRAQGELGSGLTRTDLSWRSPYVAHLSEFRSRYGQTIENEVAQARLFSRRRPRPVVILIHGYMMGRYALDERIWPIEWLDRMGFDSALFVLPFHGQRADARRKGPPEFPGRDPRMANEGFCHAVYDLRALAMFLRSRGHPALGLLGISLGGYTAALTATVEPGLEFVVPVIPLASLADYALEQGSLGRAPESEAIEYALIERVHQSVSPLARPPLIARDRVLVVGGKADRITPVSHARRLSLHFGAPLTTWTGGHIVQLGRGAVFDKVGEFLRNSVASPPLAPQKR
jgi:pimeloyl-ACP methyl ester carboxylesterase